MIFEVITPAGPGATDTGERSGLSVAKTAQLMVDEDTAPAETAPDSPEPSTEETSSEPVDSVESNDAPDDSDPDEQSDEAPQTFRVKVNGAEKEVTLDELLKGFSRTEDYTRKTQAVAEQRKAMEAEVEAVKQERARYAQALRQYEEGLKVQTPAEPDWAKLQVEDPDEFNRQWNVWSYHKQEMQKLANARAEAEAKVAEDRQRQHAARLSKEAELLDEAIPEWKNAETRKTEQQKIFEWATSQGYTPEEVQAVDDHRNVKLLRKAYLYDQMQANKPKVQATIEQVKVIPPGAVKQRQPVSEITKQRAKLAKTGTLRDAARLIELEGSV